MSEIEALLGRVLQRQVRPVVATGTFHNTHYRAGDGAGATFVKVFTNHGYWRRAVAAAPVVEPLLSTLAT